MRLVSSDGALLALRPIGYQFSRAAQPEGGKAGRTARSHGDWDANWLVIHGDVRAADGRAWTFTDPCLTTWDAEHLSAWLHAAAGQDAASGHGPAPAAFTEPSLGFFLDGRDGDRVRLRVRLSHEALPGWLPRDADGWQAGEYFLLLEVSRADLAGAARAWDRDRQPFPTR